MKTKIGLFIVGLIVCLLGGPTIIYIQINRTFEQLKCYKCVIGLLDQRDCRKSNLDSILDFDISKEEIGIAAYEICEGIEKTDQRMQLEYNVDLYKNRNE